MKKTLFGISLFMVQISLAIFYNDTIDLLVLVGIFLLTFIYILIKYFKKGYDSCEL